MSSSHREVQIEAREYVMLPIKEPLVKLIFLVDQSLQMSIFAKEIEAVTARARALGGKIIPVVPRKEGTWGYRPEGETTGWAPLDEHPDLRAGGPARLVLVTDGMSDSILGKSLASYLGMMAPGTLLFILHPWSGTEWRRSRLGRLLPGHYASRERRKRPGAVVPILDLSVSGLDAAWRRKSTKKVEFSVTLEEDDSELKGVLSKRDSSVRAAQSDLQKAERLVRLGFNILPDPTMEMLALAAFAGRPVTVAQIRHLGMKFGCRQGTVEPHELALAITGGFLTWASPDEVGRGTDSRLKLVVPEIADVFHRKIVLPKLVEQVRETVDGWVQEESSCASSV